MTQRTQIQAREYLRPELMGYLKVESDWQGEWHSHPFAETVYVSCGAFSIETQKDFKRLEVGEAVVISPGIRHLFRSRGERSEMLYAGCSYLHSGMPRDLLQQALHCPKSPEHLSLLQETASRIREMERHELEQRNASLFASLIPFWYHLMPPLSSSREVNTTIQKIEEYLHDHLSEKVQMSDLARAFYLSPHALSSQFRQVTGLGIKQYLNRLRMGRAMVLLKETDLRVGEIADMLGFETPQYFSSCFRTYYGFSPRFARERTRHT